MGGGGGGVNKIVSEIICVQEYPDFGKLFFSTRVQYISPLWLMDFANLKKLGVFGFLKYM